MRDDPAFFAEELFAKGEGWIYPDCGLDFFHKDMYNLLEERNEKTLILCPRAHMKTTCVPKIYLLHQVLFGFTQYAAMIVSVEKNRRGLKWAHSSALSNKVKFPELHYLMPYWMLDKPAIVKKNDIETVLGNGARIEYISMTSEFRGLSSDGRPDLIMMDDILPQTAQSSDKDRERVSNIFFEVIRFLGRQGARYIGTGTILHKDDLWGQIADGRIGGWKHMRLRAYNPDTKEVLWKDRWTYERLMEIYEEEYLRAGRGAAWFREMLNDPQDKQSNPFIEMEFVKYQSHKELELDKLYRIIAIDHSQGVSGDEFVIMEVGTDSEDTTYVLDYFASDITSLDERLNRVAGFIRRRGPQGVIIERTAESLSFIDALKGHLRDRGIWCPIKEPTPQKFGAKNQRITNWLAPKYYENRIVHPNSDKGRNLENQLRMFDISRRNNRDDIIDALAWAIIFSRKAGKEQKSLRPSDWRGRIWDKMRGRNQANRINYNQF